jgi:hypothetical protein
MFSGGKASEKGVASSFLLVVRSVLAMSKKSVTLVLAIAFAIATSVFVFGLLQYPSGHPCGPRYENATTSSVSNCEAGITFTFGVEEAKVLPGDNVSVYLSLTNDKPSINDICFSGLNLSQLGLAANMVSNFLAVPSPLPAVCHPDVPAVVMVYDETGSPLQLNDEIPSSVICGTTSCGVPYSLGPSKTYTEAMSFGGYWVSTNSSAPWENATFHTFSPGRYIIVAYSEMMASSGSLQPLILTFQVG